MKTFVFDVMLNGRFVCTLKYKYCALFPIDYDDTCYNPTYNGWGDGFLCEPEERSDGKHVIFKEVKE